MTHIQFIPEQASAITLSDRLALSVEVSHSIHRVSRSDWAQLDSDPLEGYDYYAAIEDSGLPGIEPRYFMIRDGQRLIAVAPAYRDRLKLSHLLDGVLGRLLGHFSVPILAVGSPVTETCSIACAPDWLARTPEILQVLIDALHRQSRLEGTWLYLFKDVAEERVTLRSALEHLDFVRVAGMPRTSLPLPFTELDGYLASLGRVMRKGLRRKLKAPSNLRIEARQHQVEDVIERMLALYADTVARSGEEIEPLTADYFRAVLAKLGERATCYLFWSGDTLIGFSLLLGDGTRQIDKVFASDGAAAREHNLYHRTWLAHVQRCIEHGIPTFEASQAAYGEKLRLGCQLLGNDHYVRHRRLWVTRVLGWLVHKAGLDQSTVAIRNTDDE
ncbi:GNAT family N-acetyltransferase [Pseudomonas sp. SLFW]|uniref:GNAT family N-acetyltransferase n=1 Tax=Pseudomonas sp. SLFW TaxID=2683259 RepID=UPI0014128FC2|nr:GNAT family N-acetyltransferase [Pseudomonas sp. SLFW]NBB08274.1 GNAT family N-acetyltransferase [Pseudomonas sp. SLFW]